MKAVAQSEESSTTLSPSAGRGRIWFEKLTNNVPVNAGYAASVLVADAELAGRRARYIAVVPDPENRFPRVRNGEIGLVEGWQLGRAVQEVIDADSGSDTKTPIVAVIDVASQAYGRREEAYGIHQALAGAASAYASARLAGHPVIGLIVGKAMSGAFLAHGYQANRLIAIDDPEVMVHAMGKASAARITLRSVEAMEAFAARIPPMAYDIKSFASLGLLSESLTLQHPDDPANDEVKIVQQSLQAALASIEADTVRDLSSRLQAKNRQSSAKVREMLRAQWKGDRA
ncbi:biotin-independent malonate decarboxylase subunit gamma [Glaciimonas sp. PAMC28666]|uniref:biotin-independent malonate decarboxylase subunit gamma n=1 Tax=Glaciimonas sp. PAMC28666 TaxID=2807626 RepID=UPI0019625D52|nr:biotin-independent malonate decarboxylase subunit gamma [Glaciimonas sp. PAMC28666]QRX82790.1 biotin-independent malonate decarboxylase subunit gamma [Glaciimonas sp. PAMC28666]